MKLHILADLHIEFADYKMPKTDADVVILAGDTHVADKGFTWVRENIRDKQVIYVFGNHEFYKAATPMLIDKLKKKSEGSNIHVLENDAVTIGDVKILGCTLWTDFELMNQLDLCIACARDQMNDYRLIRLSPSFRKIEPSFTVVWHKQSRKWLQSEFEKSKGEKVVVVTHHAPSIKSVPDIYLGDPLNAAFASNMEEFVSDSGAKLWIHGHLHTASDYHLGKTRVICNPRGYPGERGTGFISGMVVEI